MQTIRAIYNGTTFQPLQPVPTQEEYQVLITFVEPVKSADEPPQKRPLAELKGIWKGKIWMSDDFDAPLDELREYME
jgi:predicted DNA-binding antitoxin AbrB/MazE fold protein